MPNKIDEQTRRAILADCKAGELSVVEICAKYGVGKNAPRTIALEETLPKKKTAAPKPKPKPQPRRVRVRPQRAHPAPTPLTKPPKIDRDEWLRMCAKRQHYLSTVGPYPERILHPERYGGKPIAVTQPIERPARTRPEPKSMTRHAVAMRSLRERRRVIGIMAAHDRSDHTRLS
jgi:hypothetical protein